MTQTLDKYLGWLTFLLDEFHREHDVAAEYLSMRLFQLIDLGKTSHRRYNTEHVGIRGCTYGRARQVCTIAHTLVSNENGRDGNDHGINRPCILHRSCEERLNNTSTTLDHEGPDTKLSQGLQERRERYAT